MGLVSNTLVSRRKIHTKIISPPTIKLLGAPNIIFPSLSSFFILLLLLSGP